MHADLGGILIFFGGVDRWANKTLGLPCVRDVTIYMDITGFANEITKHNCQTPRFYCHDQFQVCVPTKRLGIECGADYECHSVSGYRISSVDC